MSAPAPRRGFTWPHWPSGLFEDHHGFYYEGDTIDRATLDRCLAAVRDEAPVCLSDLVDATTVDLDRPDMAGVVAASWAASRHSPSAFPRDRWVRLFRNNGQPADRPAKPVRLYRGCVPLVRYFGAGMRLVDVDDDGRPFDPDSVVEIRDTRLDLAWTADRRAARRHARNCLPGSSGAVYATVVGPEFVLAVIGATYVIDPAGLSLSRIEELR